MKMNLLIIAVFISFSCAFAQGTNQTFDPDTGLSIYELAEKYNYPLENHTVTTSDGYILRLHRISSSKNSTKIGEPVFLMHGVFSGSHDWINNGPGWSLGFILADKGYDVWLGNQRGNTYCKNHVTLDPVKNKTAFFNFSFHEIGLLDVSAMIDYVLNKTAQEKLHYIGHSQGTTAFFALASLKPEYNEKVHEMMALAPVAYLNVTSPLISLVLKYKLIIETTVAVMGIEEILPHSDLYLNITETLCSRNMSLCLEFLAILCGSDANELDENKLTVYATNSPAGASSKELLHLFQEVQSGHFRQYDYGFFGNPKHYGQRHPPDYNVTQITSPIHIFYSDDDGLTNWQNVDDLASQLPNCQKKMIENYSHVDFLWGKHVVKYIYDDIIEILGNNKINSP